MTGDDHRLGHHFARERVDFAGVDNLVVNRHDGSANEVESVGVVRHRQSEVVVTRNLGTWVPCALDAKVADIEGLTPFVGQRFLEAQNDVDWTETIGQERFGVGSQQRRIERGDVGLETANRFLNFQSVAVDVAVGNVVAIAVVETEM